MILANIEDSKLYENLHPSFKIAFEYLRSNNLSTLPVGKIELNGASVVVNVQ
ncbi:MAG: YhcH/YjgK/YiaL family protein, partial [Prevotellaceae bacterium]|nr:YhcH/YjgK/YiaL family protein [Prevotellaceae bacterium]